LRGRFLTTFEAARGGAQGKVATCVPAWSPARPARLRPSLVRRFAVAAMVSSPVADRVRDTDAGSPAVPQALAPQAPHAAPVTAAVPPPAPVPAAAPPPASSPVRAVSAAAVGGTPAAASVRAPVAPVVHLEPPGGGAHAPVAAQPAAVGKGHAPAAAAPACAARPTPVASQGQQAAPAVGPSVPAMNAGQAGGATDPRPNPPAAAQPSAQQPAPRPPPMAASSRQPHPAVAPLQPTAAAPVTASRPHQAQPAPTCVVDAPVKPPIHPYLMMWVGREATDPYEPFFVTDDDAFHARATRSYIVSNDSDAASRYHFSRLAKYPGRSLPPGYDEAPDLESRAAAMDDGVTIVHPAKRGRVSAVLFDSDDRNGAEACSGTRRAEGDECEEVAADEHYIAAVKAAAKYNRNLAVDREEMQKWYWTDARDTQERRTQKAAQGPDDDSSTSE
jgi:hypothetical protein